MVLQNLQSGFLMWNALEPRLRCCSVPTATGKVTPATTTTMSSFYAETVSYFYNLLSKDFHIICIYLTIKFDGLVEKVSLCFTQGYLLADIEAMHFDTCTTM